MSGRSIGSLPASADEIIPLTSLLAAGEEQKPGQEAGEEERSGQYYSEEDRLGQNAGIENTSDRCGEIHFDKCENVTAYYIMCHVMTN